MGEVLVAAAFAPALVDWLAVARTRTRIEYAAKPATMLVLIGAAVAFRDDAPAQQWAFTVAALGLSLAGDAFLMLPGDRFVEGLASFLLAHLAYVVAFTPSAPPPEVAGPVAAGIMLVAVPMFARLRRGMLALGRGKLVAPVAAYVVVISVMVVAAVSMLGREEVPGGAAAFAAAGALLFYASDALIGWRRFVRPFPGIAVAIMVLYHAGQAGLVLALARP